MKKAQIHLEYYLIYGFLLLVSALFIGYSIENNNQLFKEDRIYKQKIFCKDLALLLTQIDITPANITVQTYTPFDFTLDNQSILTESTYCKTNARITDTLIIKKGWISLLKNDETITIQSI